MALTQTSQSKSKVCLGMLVFESRQPNLLSVLTADRETTEDSSQTLKYREGN